MTQPNSQKTAILRVCASCEFIFRGGPECPECGFCSYGARWVYGPKAYRYEKTQEPHVDKEVRRFKAQLCRRLGI